MDCARLPLLALLSELTDRCDGFTVGAYHFIRFIFEFDIKHYQHCKRKIEKKKLYYVNI